MEKKIYGILDRRPLIWFHYVLLVGILFLSHYAGNTYFDLDNKTYIFMAIWYYIWISVGDQLIHKILGVD